MSSNSVLTPWTFRDGRDYVISLSVGENSSSLSLKVTDRITAEEWSCSYETEYIESLTQRTGSFKPFDVFVSMIKSAILKKSESVALELMNIDDLERLRSQRRESNTVVVPHDWKSTMDGTNGNGEKLSTSSNHTYMNKKSQSVNSANSKKKYLIVTYVAEFDKVHYPIPLNYSGPPDPIIMQNNIKKLRTEVSTLRHAKSALEEEVIFLKSKSLQPTPIESNSIAEDMSFLQIHQHRNPRRGQDFQEGTDMTHYSHPEDQAKIHKLMSIIEKLEEKIRTERADHLSKIDKLGAENDFFRLKVEAAEKYGIDLKTEIHQLEKQIATLNEALQQLQEEKEFKGNRRRQDNAYNSNANNFSGHYNHYRSNNRDMGGGKKTSNYNYRNRCSSTESCGSGKGNNYRETTYNHKRVNSNDQYGKSPIGLPRTRSVSPSPAEPRGRSRFQDNLRSRSSSPSRSLFDPTAYVTEKKLKQERMAQLRLENIKIRQLSDFSSNSRSRSNSKESVGSNRTYTSRNLLTTACSVCGKVCKGQCGRCTQLKSALRKDNYGLSSQCPIRRNPISGPMKTHSVDGLLAEGNNDSREPHQKRTSTRHRQRQSSLSPLSRTRHSSTSLEQDQMQFVSAELDEAGISGPRLNPKNVQKHSEHTIVGNVMPGSLQMDRELYSPLKLDINRNRNSSSILPKRTYRDMHVHNKTSKTLKKTTLEAKLSALQHFLEHRKK